MPCWKPIVMSCQPGLSATVPKRSVPVVGALTTRLPLTQMLPPSSLVLKNVYVPAVSARNCPVQRVTKLVAPEL